MLELLLICYCARAQFPMPLTAYAGVLCGCSPCAGVVTHGLAVAMQMGYCAVHMACMQENVAALKALGTSKADFNLVGPVRPR